MEGAEQKKELLKELLSLNRDYLIIRADFRTKNVDGILEITEFFPEDTFALHGYLDEQLLWDWLGNSDDIGEHLARVGFYTCSMMFSFYSDGDGFNGWTWMDLEAVKIDNFTPISVRLKEEFEWSNIAVADSETDDLPF